MTPAIVYSRWSPRPNAEDCLSIETQLDRCRTTAKATNTKSSKSTRNRTYPATTAGPS
jgi:hypothetical protein